MTPLPLASAVLTAVQPVTSMCPSIAAARRGRSQKTSAQYRPYQPNMRRAARVASAPGPRTRRMCRSAIAIFSGR